MNSAWSRSSSIAQEPLAESLPQLTLSLNGQSDGRQCSSRRTHRAGFSLSNNACLLILSEAGFQSPNSPGRFRYGVPVRVWVEGGLNEHSVTKLRHHKFLFLVLNVFVTVLMNNWLLRFGRLPATCLSSLSPSWIVDHSASLMSNRNLAPAEVRT